MVDPHIAVVMFEKRIKNYAQGAGDADLTAVCHLKERVFHMETDLFRKNGKVTFPGILQDYDKFFTPDAANHIILPDRFTEPCTELLEHHTMSPESCP